MRNYICNHYLDTKISHLTIQCLFTQVYKFAMVNSLGDLMKFQEVT